MGTVGATKMGDTFSTLKDQLIRGGQQKKETCQPAVNTKEVQADKVLLRLQRKNHLVLRAGGSCVDLASDIGLVALQEEVGLHDSGYIT